MSERKWKVGDPFIVFGMIRAPIGEYRGYTSVAIDGSDGVFVFNTSALRPAPPEPDGRRFRVQKKGEGWWVELVHVDPGGITIRSAPGSSGAVFEPSMRAFFEARDARYEIVPVELEPEETAESIAVKALEEINDPYGPGYTRIMEIAREAMARIKEAR